MCLPRAVPAELPAEPERLLDTPTYEGFAVRPLYTALDAQPEAALPGQWPFTRGGDGTRDVLSGWRVMETFPGPGEAPGDGNATVLSALSDGVSGLVLRVGAGGTPAGDLDRRLEGVFLELVPVVLDAGVRLHRRRRRRAGAGGRAPGGQAVRVVDRLRRRPADGGAGRHAGPLDRSRDGTRGPVGRLRRRGAGDHGRRPGFAQPRRQRGVGTGRCASPRASSICGCSPTPGWLSRTPLRQISFRFAADDDQFMTIAKLRAARHIVGAGRRGGRRAGRGRGDGARRHLAADDGPARPVGEHAAEHAGGVRRRRRRRRHGPGATRSTWRSRAVRPAWRRASPAASRATPSCCCSRSPTSAGCSTRRPGRGSSRTSPSNWRDRRGRTSRPSRRTAASARRPDSSPSRSPRWRPVAPTTSHTAGHAVTGINEFPNLAEPALPQC